MKKLWKRTVGTALCLVTLCSVALPLYACKEDKAIEYDSEKDVLTIGVSSLQGNFNPFYAKAEGDIAVVNQTQAPFITMGADGYPLATVDEGTVARSFAQTTYNAKGEETKDPTDAVTTRYEFVIKDEATFSDGTLITVKDVLFNLYAYLDPAYTGDTALRDLDIVGLDAYRLQTTDTINGETAFIATAKSRVTDIVNRLKSPEKFPDTANVLEAEKAEIKALIKDYLADEWGACEGTLGEYDDHRFTEDWQLFYCKQGLVEYQYEYTVSGGIKRKEDGKYYTTLDPSKNSEIAKDAHLTSAMQETVSDTKHLLSVMTAYNCDKTTAVKYAKRDLAIETAYYTMTHDNEALLNALDNKFIYERIIKEFSNQAHLASLDKAMVVKNISGIEVNPEGPALRDHNGRALVEPCDLLRITVNGVDPMGIYNFIFPVAPMHYYSDSTHTKAAMEDTEHKEAFGVEFADAEFFKTVIGEEKKTALPLGAGAYVPTNSSDADLSEEKGFFLNETVYLKRNTHFETVGEDLDNAKIKHVRYTAVGSEKRLEAIQDGTIDIGTVTTGKAVWAEAEKLSKVACIAQGTNSYAYVGINPKFVPEIEVRQALMRAFNRKLALAYYTDSLAQLVERPVGAQSWAEAVDEEGNKVSGYESMSYTRTASEIETLVEQAGYRRNAAGKYAKNGKTLSYAFVIPSDTTDHFAFAMFTEAAEWLNQNCGFDVTVVCNALATPERGGCAVWAAERTILPDPDLYSVFHKDGATGFLGGWGYYDILANTGNVYEKEKKNLLNLTRIIEKARNIVDQEDRLELYTEAYGYLESLCIELPVCQSYNLVAYNSKKLNAKTFNADTGFYVGAFDRLWEVNFK